MQSQIAYSKILWDKTCNCPVKFATISNSEHFAISNDDGNFLIKLNNSAVDIQMLGYEPANVLLENQQNDTIFLTAKGFELDEIIIDTDEKYKIMIKTIATEYELDTHTEQFFLRSIIRKNKELYKIIDFSGTVEKKTLFDTNIKPMLKKNYIVQIENIRKAGIEGRNYAFGLNSFETFLTRIASIYFVPKFYKFSYKNTIDDNFSKIIVSAKDAKVTTTDGYYLVDNGNNTFNEVYLIDNNKNAEFISKRSVKYRNVFFEQKTNFKRNIKTNKYQINFSIVKLNVEVISDNKTDVFEVTQIYNAIPTESKLRLKNNIDISDDMFDINGKYDPVYWENHDILPLTKEMQEFINMVNSSSKKSDFKTKTNIK